MVCILAAQSIGTVALNPPSPRIHLLTPPPTPAALLAFLAVSRLRCHQFSTSSSKSAAFFLIAVCGYLTKLPGQQILRPIQQLERCRLFNQDLEGTQLIHPRFPSFSVAHQRFRFRSVRRSPASLSKGRGSRILAGGYGTSRTLWSIPTTPVLSESSRGSPNIWATSSTKRKEGM